MHLNREGALISNVEGESFVQESTGLERISEQIHCLILRRALGGLKVQFLVNTFLITFCLLRLVDSEPFSLIINNLSNDFFHIENHYMYKYIHMHFDFRYMYEKT